MQNNPRIISKLCVLLRMRHARMIGWRCFYDCIKKKSRPNRYIGLDASVFVCRLVSSRGSGFIVITIGQPWSHVVGRRLHHPVSMLACLMLSPARSCRSSISPGLSCHRFLSYVLQVGTGEMHRSCLTRPMCSAHDHFIFLTHLKAKLYWISSDTHQLQLIKLHHLKLEIFKSI